MSLPGNDAMQAGWTDAERAVLLGAAAGGPYTGGKSWARGWDRCAAGPDSRLWGRAIAAFRGGACRRLEEPPDDDPTSFQPEIFRPESVNEIRSAFLDFFAKAGHT